MRELEGASFSVRRRIPKTIGHWMAGDYVFKTGHWENEAAELLKQKVRVR
ncbi:hypothetical protein GCM10009022_37850 [Vreelandella titanicae]|jgi:hypothetical protein|tara:strand:+ start:2480 stop:2629 length:150 start_codon:yes stop_codon:yes gene_type:complete